TSKLKAIVTRHARWLIGQAGAMHRAVEPIAGTVAGEDAAGAVTAVRRRRKADDEDPGSGVAKTGHGPTPVGPFAISGAFFAGDKLTPLDQSGTAEAGNDL